MMPSAVNPALVVRAAKATCAFPLAQVLETMRPLPIQSVANLPQFVLGVALVRGAPAPVVNLAAFFDAAAVADGARFVTVRGSKGAIAILVESVVGVVELKQGNFHELPTLFNQLRPEAIESIGRLDSELVVVLQSARLVPDSVWETVRDGSGSLGSADE
jgi:purine-binding chemotaxis protein CheW